jgi:Zn-dependent protease
MFDAYTIPTALICYVALLLSLSVHEASHAGAAYLLGDDTAASLGRLSFNPIVHMDMVGTVIFPLLGLIFGGFFIGWAKPVPYNPRRFRPAVPPKGGGAFVSFAGPLSNLVLSLVFMVVLCLATIALARAPQARFGLVDAAFQGPQALDVLGVSTGPMVLLSLAGMLVQINILLAFFNLIPLGPLDGAGVLRGFVPDRILSRYDRLRYHPAMWGVLIVLLFTGIVGLFLSPVRSFYFRHVIAPVARLILGA